ncbi:MAG: hypothetical protein JW759_07485 [Candidatus Coatesbacteria bacterium]|nr:hypothetical protein [Candidatus Coatesbacteria bacterium]
MSREPNVVLFTGQSGIKAMECLSRLSQEMQGETEAISIEQTMELVSGRSFARLLLSDPIPIQHKWWKEAFEHAGARIEKCVGKDVFLTLHAVYYHQKSREFVSPASMDVIRRTLKGRVKALMVLIDDIYDVYLRLTTEGQMYRRVLTECDGPIQALYETAFNLISLLQWREFEIAVSRIIARYLDVPMYVVAAKHPKSMIARLITAPIRKLKLFYLSHPISAVREQSEDLFPELIGELKRFSTLLIDDPHTVLFMPTTIDEYRIKKKQPETYLPELTKRWPCPCPPDKMLCPCMPRDLKDVNPLNPRNCLAEDPERPDITASISRLMAHLSEHIYRDITSRDFALVEQSKNGVVAYRPCFPSKLAGGVRAELSHNKTLFHELPQSEGARRALIVSFQEDYDKGRIGRFVNELKVCIKEMDHRTEENLHDLFEQESSGDWVKMLLQLSEASSSSERDRVRMAIKGPIIGALPKDCSFDILLDQGLHPEYIAQKEMKTDEALDRSLGQSLKDDLRERDKYLLSNDDYRICSDVDDAMQKIEELLGRRRRR